MINEICTAERIETVYELNARGRECVYGVAEPLASGAVRISLNSGEVVLIKRTSAPGDEAEWSCVRENDGFGSGLTRIKDYLVYAISDCLKSSCAANN